MKLVLYRSADYKNENILQVICEGLVTGYDPVLLLNNLHNSEIEVNLALSAFRRLIYYGHCYEDIGDDVDDEKISYNIRKTPDPIMFYEHPHLVPFNSKSFTIDQLVCINRGIKKRLDVSVYAKPEYSEKVMETIIKVMEQNKDVKPFIEIVEMVPRFTDEQLQFIAELYTELGDKVISVIKGNADTYRQLPLFALRRVAVADVFEFASAEQLRQLAVLPEREMENRLEELMKERIKSIIAEEGVKQNMKVSSLRFLNGYSALEELLFLWYRTGTLLPFYLMKTQNESLYNTAKYWVERTGIIPSIAYTEKDLRIVKAETITTEQRGKLVSLLKQKLFLFPFSYTTEQLAVLYRAYRRGIDLFPHVDNNYSAELLEVIARYLEKGTDVSQYVIPSEILESYDRKLDRKAYASLVDTLGYLLAEHQLNLFPEVMSYINSIKAQMGANLHREIEKIAVSVNYIAGTLFVSMYELPEKREQTKQAVDKILQLTINNGKYLPYLQMMEIHRSILENVDISEYVKDETIEYLDVIRKSLKHNINNIVDYIKYCGKNCDPLIMRHIYRITVGYAIPNKTVKLQNRLPNEQHPFHRAVEILESPNTIHKQQNNV